MRDAPQDERPSGGKLTSRSKARGGRFLALRRILITLFILLILVGIIPFVIKLFCPYIGVFNDKILSHICKRSTWNDLLQWGGFCITLAMLVGGVIPVWQYLEPRIMQAKLMRKRGVVPNYGKCKNPRPTNESLYNLYCGKSDKEDRRTGFKIANVPVFFVIPPAPGLMFNVRVQSGGEEFKNDTLSREAARFGLNWEGFTKWRLEEKSREYNDKPLWEHGIRCVEIKREGDGYLMIAAKTSFAEYVCSELSVNLNAEWLPNMRHLFEGERWHEDRLKLLDIKDAANRYSMLASVSVLVTTRDPFLILHRRSTVVSEGAGGISATAAGFTSWRYDRNRCLTLLRSLPIINRRLKVNPLADSLKRAALRELREEIGLTQDDLDDSFDLVKPFMGAGFNLLHGRDLNFYAHFHSRLRWSEIEARRSEAKDSWEVDSLLPVPLENITLDGKFRLEFSGLLPKCNRHLRAALYAFAKSGRLELIKKHPYTGSSGRLLPI